MINKSCSTCHAWGLLFCSWIISTVATLGSLFFSEVMKYPPCVLCWYQRICMYPLVFILIAGIFPVSKVVIKFSLPLTMLGLGISLYHNLLYYKILPQSILPCVQGISCTTVYFEILGFITIPFLSFISFLLIFILLIVTNRILTNET